MRDRLARLPHCVRARLRRCRHAGLVLPLKYYLLEDGAMVELDECDDCGTMVAR